MMTTGASRHVSDLEVVFRQGDVADNMYVVRRGKVRIFRDQDGKETTLAVLNPGEFFGEMALFDSKSRSASAAAVGDTELEVVSRVEFEELVSSDTVWGVLRKMSERIREASNAFEKLNVESLDRQDAVASISLRRNLFY